MKNREGLIGADIIPAKLSRYDLHMTVRGGFLHDRVINGKLAYIGVNGIQPGRVLCFGDLSFVNRSRGNELYILQDIRREL